MTLVDLGRFIRLFNVTVDRDHPLNVEGVPDGFQVMDLGPVQIEELAFSGDIFCSEKMTERNRRREVGGGDPMYAYLQPYDFFVFTYVMTLMVQGSSQGSTVIYDP